jgi:adenylate cyclase class 2
MIEREIKLRFAGPGEARAAVVAAGATLVRERRLQDDAILDTRGQRIRKRGCALRVRWDGGHSRLTFKGPVTPGAMKVRDEHETIVAEGEVIRRILEELGLRVWFRYQKYREEYAADGVTVAIDETPVGTFVEIEGSEDGILAMATALGRTPADFVLESYRKLFLMHREERGIDGPHMLFDIE